MITENLDVFVADFGCPVVCGAVNTTGILDMPGDVLLGNIVSDDYMLTFKTAALPGLRNGTALTVDCPLLGPAPTAFTVRDARPHGDGAFSVAYLSRV